MKHKFPSIEITVDVISHATEDPEKLFLAFKEFDLDDFEIQDTTGHFDNPIKMIHAKVVKKQAQNLLEKIIHSLSKEQIDELIRQIPERTVDSRFHMRLGKQELINGDLRFEQSDPIKIKIHTPIYNKKDTTKIFTKLLSRT